MDRIEELENISKPRLLITTTTLPRFKNDPEPRFVIDLARKLKDRFDITILAPSDPEANTHEFLFGVEVIRYRYAPLRSLETLAYPGGIMSRLKAAPIKWGLVPLLIIGQSIALRRLMRMHKFDVIHAHWTLPQGLIAITLPRKLRVPVVTTAHGGDIYNLGFGPLKPLLKYVIRNANAVTGVSQEIYNDLCELNTDDRNNRHIYKIPMGVDVKHFSTNSENSKRPIDIPEKGPVILFVGRLVEKKGIHILIEALSIMRKEQSTAQVVIIGDGPQKNYLIDCAAEHNVSDYVHFLGARAHNCLPAYLAAADVFALPSIHAKDGDKDGLPVTLMEAAACGVPAVASKIGGVPEFLNHGYNGIMVSPGDAAELAAGLAHILHQSEVHEKFSASALSTARQFDWENIADKYADVIFSVLNRNIQPVANSQSTP